MDIVGSVTADLQAKQSRLRNKLIVGYKPQPWSFRCHRYEVFRFKHQWEVLVKVVELLIDEDESLSGQLVEADRKDWGSSSQREVRYIAQDKDSLPPRNIRKAGDIYLGLTLNKGQKNRLLRRICGVVGVDFSQERRIEI